MIGSSWHGTPKAKPVEGSRRSLASGFSPPRPWLPPSPIQISSDSGRQFAAWLGLTPQQHSTGGKTRLGGISKQGDRYLRRLLVVGATAVIRHIKDNPTPLANWVRKLMEKKPFRLVSVALANKLARIAWVVLTRKETYQPYKLPA